MKKDIFLLSDEVIHWNIVPSGNRKTVFKELWGSASTRKFFHALQSFFKQAGADLDWSITGPDNFSTKAEEINPTNEAFNHCFATWKPFNEGSGKAWRIQDIVHVGKNVQPLPAESIMKEVASADVVLFQDWGLNIRNFEIAKLADSLRNKWVIYRSYPPLFEGPLWQEVLQSAGKQKMILLRADDLRLLNTSISKGLSWEQTTQDLINEIYIKRNVSLHALRVIEYVLISFGCTGTLLIHNDVEKQDSQPQIKLFFDSMGIERYWEGVHPGYMPGDLELLAALLTKEILYPESKDGIIMDKAIRAHLLARRALITAGANVAEGSLALELLPAALSGVYGADAVKDFSPVRLDLSQFETLYQEKSEKEACTSGDWSLLGMTDWDLYSLARKIALEGPIKALSGWNIPVAQYHYLLTADRKEIEFLHNLKTLISEYLQNKNNQPLSIAVFGSPGSGKSFSIKQLAESLDIPGNDIEDATFNLSQFNEDNPAGLYQAFHAVRDISLSGKIPLVFWDEFDSKQLAWLRYFLAPMQDGEFQEGQLTHNIGKSIFVFAGGTCSCMEEFEVKVQQAVAEKGPDFLSRLKGYINVMGPNPVLSFTEKNLADRDAVRGAAALQLARNADPEYIIRRAILINSLMNINYRHLFKDKVLQIDDGVLNALLLTPKYKHGTRSMETIFKTSQLFGKGKFHRSDLPPESQMNLHVDGQEFYELMSQEIKYYEGGDAFYRLVNEITLDEKTVERMAVGIHAIYSLVFSSGKANDPLSITKEEFDSFYAEMKRLPQGLPPDEVSQNYHNARKIPEKLAAVGFTIVPATAKQKADAFSDKELEKISRLEHIRWVLHHIDSGWRYSSSKNKSKKQHDALVAWDEAERKNAQSVYGTNYCQKMGIDGGNILSEYYRNLDRVISKAIPWILEDVGFKMVKAKGK